MKQGVTQRMQLEIKCRDLSLCSAIQWKATHPTWGCKSRSFFTANCWKATHPPRRYTYNSRSETYSYALPISEKQQIQLEDANQDPFSLPMGAKAIHPQRGYNLRSGANKTRNNPKDATEDQLQRLIFMLCQSVKRNTSNLRMQIKIKFRDLSLCSANQWKATHPPWGCKSRSNAETYLYALPFSEKQHIQFEDANQDLFSLPIGEKQHIPQEDTHTTRDQRLIFMLCQSVKSNTSNLRMQIKIFFHCQLVKSNTSPKRIQLEIKSQ